MAENLHIGTISNFDDGRATEDPVAVFIDFENIAISAEETYGRCDLSVVMEAAEQWGRCIIKRAYGDWTRFSKYRQELAEHAIELTQLFSHESHQRKNAADIQMVVDALETAFTHPDILVFVLVTGDSDFSAVARKLREYGKRVVGIGLRQATSEMLVKACDRFILYDTLVESEGRPVAAGYSLERARQLLLNALRRLSHRFEGGRVLASVLKKTMLKLDPTFSEFSLGFHQFRDFVEAQSDIVEPSVRGTELAVALKSYSAREPALKGAPQYRAALAAGGLSLMDPQTRAEVLQDLFHLLWENPDKFTFDEAVMQLKAGYDAGNILRSRDEVYEVAKLIKYADVLDPRPQSWELDPLTVKSCLEMRTFVEQCESSYVTVLLQKNLEIELDSLALLLFGTSDQHAQVEQLVRLARESLSERAMAPCEATGWEWPGYLRQIPELQVALQDLENCPLDEEPTLMRAAELNSEGLRLRTTNFERAQSYFLKAARIMYELIQRGEPGASFMDLEWYLASYCATMAGVNFVRYEYSQAAVYYLAFFALGRETEPVWDKLQKLVPPMLSFYFTIAPNENKEVLNVSPGRTHPARLAVILHHHSNPGVREHWLQLVDDLVRVNPTLLRALVIRRLELLDEVPGARDTQRALIERVQGAEVGIS